MITQEAIQQRSYLIWEREGRPHGRHHEHWAQAEAELRAEGALAPKRARARRKASPMTDAKRSRAADMTPPPVTH